MEDITSEIIEFNNARDWDKFHSPENLAKSIAIEAGELLECFQWGEAPNLEDVKMELADVLNYCLLLADKLKVKPDEILREKLRISAEKYPVAKAKGKALKYTQLK